MKVLTEPQWSNDQVRDDVWFGRAECMLWEWSIVIGETSSVPVKSSIRLFRDPRRDSSWECTYRTHAQANVKGAATRARPLNQPAAILDLVLPWEGGREKKPKTISGSVKTKMRPSLVVRCLISNSEGITTKGLDSLYAVVRAAKYDTMTGEADQTKERRRTMLQIQNIS